MAFIAKQMVGNQLKSVKGALGDKEESEETPEGEEAGEDPEIVAARLEAEEKRKEKHRKMEEEREGMRQTIRDKYGLKKKEIPPEEEPLGDDGRIGRKKKTPAELAAEANADSDDDEFAKFPSNLSEFTAKVSEIPSKLADSMGEVTSKCTLQ